MSVTHTHIIISVDTLENQIHHLKHGNVNEMTIHWYLSRGCDREHKCGHSGTAQVEQATLQRRKGILRLEYTYYITWRMKDVQI